MIPSRTLCDELDERGFGLFAGVPCSWLGGPIEELTARGSYVAAANEGAALSIATGARLAGRQSCVFLQNSGLGNLINPLTSLSKVFEIPILAFVSMRGWPDPEDDEPQHAIMGRETSSMLASCGARAWLLSGEPSQLTQVLDEAATAMSEGDPAFILVPQGAFSAARRTGATISGISPRTALELLGPALEDALVFATTGLLSRELHEVADRPGNFYIQGSMGHSLAIGIGAALVRTDRRTIVLDGDGALLMHLGTMSTVGTTKPSNLLHVVFDNGSYESTGGQSTTAGEIDWVGLGLSLGYSTSRLCGGPDKLAAVVAELDRLPAPALLAIKVRGRDGVVSPRVTESISPTLLRERMERTCRLTTTTVAL
jgi:phosphonopyruvate decarboxylase